MRLKNMRIGKKRKNMRIESLIIASDLIHDYHLGGMTHEDAGMTEEEFKIFCEENIRTSKVLLNLAKKLME